MNLKRLLLLLIPSRYVLLGLDDIHTVILNKTYRLHWTYSQTLVPPQAVVVRNKNQKTIHASQIVPGDIIYVRTGDKVPADAIVVSASELKVDNSSLTGESDALSRTPCKGATKSVLMPKLSTQFSISLIPKPVEPESLDPMDSTHLIFNGSTIVSGKASFQLFDYVPSPKNHVVFVYLQEKDTLLF
jgi:magnesium-transporting ATPase (P-type)